MISVNCPSLVNSYQHATLPVSFSACEYQCTASCITVLHLCSTCTTGIYKQFNDACSLYLQHLQPYNTNQHNKPVENSSKASISGMKLATAPGKKTISQLIPGPDHGPSVPWGMEATAGPSYIYLHIFFLEISGPKVVLLFFRSTGQPGLQALRLQPHQPHGWSGPD